MLMTPKINALPLGYILIFKLELKIIPCEDQTHVFALKKQRPNH